MALVKNLDSSGILTITLSRPDALNALNYETMNALAVAFEDILRDKTVRSVILTGDGEKAFVAGADIKELAALNSQQALQLSKGGQQLFKTIEDCPKPVIAAVNGFALGGGCELAMACHVRIATESARFGQPEVNLGIIPGYGGTQRLTQMVGRGKALEMLLTGDMVSAQEALVIGLVNHVVTNREALMEMAHKIAMKIIAKGPLAIARTIASVNAGFESEEAGYHAEATNFAACSSTDDFREGTTAFLEKRAPVFKGE